MPVNKDERVFSIVAEANRDILRNGDCRCAVVGVRNRETGELGILAVSAVSRNSDRIIPVELRIEGAGAGRSPSVPFQKYQGGLTPEELAERYSIVDLLDELNGSRLTIGKTEDV